jgi:hypothetical protein
VATYIDRVVNGMMVGRMDAAQELIDDAIALRGKHIRSGNNPGSKSVQMHELYSTRRDDNETTERG